MSLPSLLPSTACFCLLPIDSVKMSVDKESLTLDLEPVRGSPLSDASGSLITESNTSNTIYTEDSDLLRDLLIDERGNVLTPDELERHMMSKVRSGGHPLLNILCGFGVESHVLAHFL